MVLRGQVVTFGAPLVFVKAAAERDPGAARALQRLHAGIPPPPHTHTHPRKQLTGRGPGPPPVPFFFCWPGFVLGFVLGIACFCRPGSAARSLGWPGYFFGGGGWNEFFLLFFWFPLEEAGPRRGAARRGAAYYKIRIQYNKGNFYNIKYYII